MFKYCVFIVHIKHGGQLLDYRNVEKSLPITSSLYSPTSLPPPSHFPPTKSNEGIFLTTVKKLPES